MHFFKKWENDPIIQNYFSFKGRINRKYFFFYSLQWALLLIALYYVDELLSRSPSPISEILILIPTILICHRLSPLSNLSLATRRLHDMGYQADSILCLIYGLSFLSPALDSFFHANKAIIHAVSLFNTGCSLYLLFGRGDKGPNKYGEPK